jgi:hypothetical protein
VIGGKDNATSAMSSVEKSLTRLEAKTDSLGRSTLSLTKLTAGIAGAYALFSGAMASLSGLSKAIDDFDRVGETIRQLDQSMQLNGGASKELLNEYTALSDTLEVLTNVEAETTQEMMRQAAIMGVSNDQLDDMAIAAIGLSEAMGMPLDTAMEKVRLATEGNFRAFEKLIPSMKTMATDEEKLAAVMELSARGMSMKEEASKSAAGVAEQMGHRWGTFMEVIGGILSPIRQLVNYGIIVLADAMTQVLGPATEYSQSMLENMGPLMDYVKDKVIEGINLIVGAFTFFEVVVTNLDSVWQLAVAQSELWMLQLVGSVMHAFTVAIPAYLEWFGGNFVNLLRDAFNGAYAIVVNGITNIKDAMVALFEYLASWGDTDLMSQLGEIGGRSLLEGFKSSLTDFPEIAARVITDREQELAQTIGQVGANLGDEFNRKMAERMITAGAGVANELSKNIELKVKTAMDDATGAGASGAAGSGTQQLNAAESRLLTRGPADRGNELLERAVAALQKIMASSSATATATNSADTKLGFIDDNTSNTVQMVPVA